MTTKQDASSKANKVPVPAGTHIARCYQFLHIGHVPNTYPGAVSPIQNKIRLTWELPDEKMVFNAEKGEQPFTISQEYTLSMFKLASLRKIIESWRGVKMTDEEAADFDIESLVGMPCFITIAHVVKGENTYANVQNVTSLPKSIVCPEPINKTSITNWETMSVEEFGKLPKFLQDKMKQAAEYGPWCAKNNVENQAF